MKPHYHVVFSIAVVVGLTLLLDITSLRVLWWLALGLAAGVLVDVDHLVYGLIRDRRAVTRSLLSNGKLLHEYHLGGSLYVGTFSNPCTTWRNILIFWTVHTTTIAMAFLAAPSLLVADAIAVQAPAIAHWICDFCGGLESLRKAVERTGLRPWS